MKCTKPSYAFALAMHIKDINKTNIKQTKYPLCIILHIGELAPYASPYALFSPSG